MGNFQDSSAVRSTGDSISATLDPAWGIWGPSGGYMATIALRAASSILGPDQRPVTLSCQYVGRPEFGEIEIEASIVKQGSTSCTNVKLMQAGKCFLQAQVWTTNKNKGPVNADATMPDVPAPETLETVETHLSRHGRPPHAFWSNLDGRPVRFYAPPDPDPRGAILQQWHRFKGFEPTQDPFLNSGRAVLLIDTLIWAAHWRGLSEDPSYISPSLDLTVWFHTPGIESDWLLAEGHADTARDGLIHGGVRIWSKDGQLIASGGSQLLVLPIRS